MTSNEPVPKPLARTSYTKTLNTTQTYDLVCIGFGPAQLATAIANREAQQSSNLLFLERKSSFSRHSGSHMSRTRMENAFLYDLATIRNPRSSFTYVNYLLSRDRLIEFANSDRLNPLRVEFEDYLRWCAEQFSDQVQYGTEVVEVAPETTESTVSAWKITVKDAEGKTQTIRARSLVAPSAKSQSSPQTKPLTTVDFLAGQRIISTSDYLSRRNELRGAQEPRLNISIVGNGQQTIEILDDLLSCPRLGNITVVTEDQTLAPLQILGEQEPPQPTMCSIWAKPSCTQKSSIIESSELIQTIYMRAYEKQIISKGQCSLRVIIGQNAEGACSDSDFIIRDTTRNPMSSTRMLQSLDKLVLGCRSSGDSMEEVHFKRGAVAEDCRMFFMSSHSEGGRSLAKDIAVMAGKVVSAVRPVAEAASNRIVVQARI